MTGLWAMWLQFFASAALVILGGIKLTRYADLVSDRFGLHKAWTGMLLLGAVTSFPEFAASFSSAVFVQAPNLAMGNIAGSINVNLMIIVLMDFFYRKGSVTSQVRDPKTYEFSALCFSLMASIAVVEIFFASYFKIFTLGSMSYGSILIVGIYVLGSKIVFGLTNQEIPFIDPSCQKAQQASQPLVRFIVSALIVIVGGLWLSGSCYEITRRTLLGQTFVGVIFMGVVTSLPEIVVSLAALKMGAFDLAFGNVLGSNIFNILILSICDLFYWQGPLFQKVSEAHVFLVALSIAMTTIFAIGIQKTKKRTYGRFGLDTIFMLICFAIMMKFLYDLR